MKSPLTGSALRCAGRPGRTSKRSPGRPVQAGVQSAMFGIFHDAGYKGLYGGLGVGGIKHRKRIPERDNLMDRMNPTELAANQFRMTQARDKLLRDGIHGQDGAIDTHLQVGREVREAIERIGGVLPENIPPAEHIKDVERRLSSATPRLELEERDAAGLLGANTPPDGGEQTP